MAKTKKLVKKGGVGNNKAYLKNITQQQLKRRLEDAKMNNKNQKLILADKYLKCVTTHCKQKKNKKKGIF